MSNNTTLFDGAAVRSEHRRTQPRNPNLTLSENLLVEHLKQQQEANARAKAEWVKQQAENRRLMQHHLAIVGELLADMGKPADSIELNDAATCVYINRAGSSIRVYVGSICTEQERRLAISKVLSAATGLY